MPAPDFDIPPSKVVRTPDERFKNITDFPYTPRYGYLRGLRYAFIDETSGIVYNEKELSPVEAKDIPAEDVHWETYMCLHGQPTWSYLYRRMIPVFLGHSPAGSKRYIRRRVLAPDFFGCGRSDKPIEDAFYTWDMHLEFLINCNVQVISHLSMGVDASAVVRRHVVAEGPASGDVIGVVQVRDSCISSTGRTLNHQAGGLLGLTLPPIFPNLFTHLLVMNTGLGLGKPPSKGWIAFHDFIKRSPDAKVGALIARGTKHLTPKEIAAYDAPHPDYQSKASVRRFPPIVPREPDMPGVASSYAALAYYNHLLPSQLRVFVAIGTQDPVLGEPVMDSLVRIAFPATGSFVLKHPDAGHFVQEWGGPIAQKALDAWCVPQGREEQVAIPDVEWIAPKPPSSRSKL